MALKIAGYVAPDQETADFEYETILGVIYITAKRVSKHNKAFAKAISHFHERAQRRKKIAKGSIDEQANRDYIGLYYDHVVTAWSTTIEQEDDAGNRLPIESTRENFIDLMEHEHTKGVFDMFAHTDVTDDENFRSASEDEDLGKSQKRSAGSSSGDRKKTGSET